jgi:hypothetical protein
MAADDEARLIVKPAAGRLVRHPRTMRPLDAEGQDVTSERGYFHRMLRAGDVVIVPPRKVAPPTRKQEA